MRSASHARYRTSHVRESGQTTTFPAYELPHR